MSKLEDAKRRFGSPDVISGAWPRQRYTSEEVPGLNYFSVDTEAAADAGDVKQLQARNLRLKLEVNALQKLLNEKDEELDSLRDPKWIRWVCATLVVVLVGLASFMRLN